MNRKENLNVLIYVIMIRYISSESPLNGCETPKPYRKPDSTCASLEDICAKKISKSYSAMDEMKSQINSTNQLCTSAFNNFQSKEKQILEDSYKNVTVLLQIIGPISRTLETLQNKEEQLLVESKNITDILRTFGLTTFFANNKNQSLLIFLEKIQAMQENVFGLAVSILLLFILIPIIIGVIMNKIFRKQIKHKANNHELETVGEDTVLITPDSIENPLKEIKEQLADQNKTIEADIITLKESNQRLENEIDSLKMLSPQIEAQSTSFTQMNTSHGESFQNIKEQQNANKKSMIAIEKKLDSQDKLLQNLINANSQIKEQLDLIKDKITQTPICETSGTSDKETNILPPST